MPLLKSALTLLADGQLHSEKEISLFLGIPRNLVFETLQQLIKFGIKIKKNSNAEYHIAEELELLNEKLIFHELGATYQLLDQLEILLSIDSTNTYLLEKAKTSKQTLAVFAERQTAGRGQFNRAWISSCFSKNIALSILWHLPNEPNKLTGLSLVIGLAVIKTLMEYGLKGIELKWPNDIVYNGKKLAGILVETRSSHSKSFPVVIGLGLNLYSNPTISIDSISQVITSIHAIQKLPPQRNRLAGLLLKHVLAILCEFQTKGFSSFIETWQKFDSLKDRFIHIQTDSGILEGIARGVNSQAQLRIEVEGKIHSFNNGEIRIRLNHSSANC